MFSARTTLVVTTAVILSGSLVIGNGLGLLSGYRGGWVDALIMRVGDVFSSLPGLVMLILINATLGARVTAAVEKALPGATIIRVGEIAVGGQGTATLAVNHRGGGD